MGVEQARPWWASDDPSVDELAIDEDPLTAHRTARRPAETDGERDRGPDRHAPSAGEVQDASPSAEVRDVLSASDSHDASTCGLCPVCIGLRLLGEHRPEVLDHLNEASRHLTAAIRGLLEPGVDSGRGERNARRSPDTFERIQVDGPDEEGGSGSAAGDPDVGGGSGSAAGDPDVGGGSGAAGGDPNVTERTAGAGGGATTDDRGPGSWRS
jgi:hypothetical protein